MLNKQSPDFAPPINFFGIQIGIFFRNGTTRVVSSSALNVGLTDFAAKLKNCILKLKSETSGRMSERERERGRGSEREKGRERGAA